MTEGLWTVLVAVMAGTLSVLAALMLMRAMAGYGPRRAPPTLLEGDLQPIAFLFKGMRLVDATDSGRMLLDGVSGPNDPWQRLVAWLAPRFPDALADLDGRVPAAHREYLGDSGVGSARLRLSVGPAGQGMTRLTLTDPTADHAGIVVDSLAQHALEDELAMLRSALDLAPMLVWRQDDAGRVSWANAAYLRQAEAGGDGSVVWPLPRLADLPPTPGAKRIQMTGDGATHWYDCRSQRVDDHLLVHALPADAAVRAERSLREFVQTLTKTFADLPIGLAIFDRERRLQLFNPALIDLTGLPTGFLTARPTLFDFLDRMREARMVPEPKDYRSWRQQMANLEAAAATGHHVETWSLPGGQTYRVTGRPHPDGAVAFLLEDITSEITLTRKFRAELALGHDALDAMDDAMAMFDGDGRLLISNQAYTDLWHAHPADAGEAIEQWSRQVDIGPGFERLVEVLRAGCRDAVAEGAMAGPGGGLLAWRVWGIGHGRCMLRFRADPAERPEPFATMRPVDDRRASAPARAVAG